MSYDERYPNAEPRLAADGDGPTASGAGVRRDDDLDAIRRERDELNDRLLRAAAEFDNYRKRSERERRDWSDAVTREVVRDFLPAVDDVERALAASTAEQSALRRGLELIHQKLVDALKRRGVEPIDALGQPFDPNVHEAVAYEHAEGHPDGEVVAVLQRGFRLGDKLLRPAMVKVAKA